MDIEPLTQKGREELRKRYEAEFSPKGESFDDFESAYLEGRYFACHDGGKSWDEIEPEARRLWESEEHDLLWDRARDAVRSGWEQPEKCDSFASGKPLVPSPPTEEG